MDVANRVDPYNGQRKIVKILCRIQVFDKDKVMIKEAVGEFQSGEKIEFANELGVDLRHNAGTEYEQELKIYETCAKIAIIRAVKQL
jgi:hypothetical protein